MSFGENLIIGLISGVFIAGTGYLKSRKQEKFSYRKFLQTTAVGGFVGAIAGAMGWNFHEAYRFLADMGMIQLFENGKKALIRHFFKK